LILARSRSGIIGDKERTGIPGIFRLSHPARVNPGSPAQDKEPELREVPGFPIPHGRTQGARHRMEEPELREVSGFPREKAGDADEIASGAMIHHYRLAAIPFFAE
jgi:hypothetical protein